MAQVVKRPDSGVMGGNCFYLIIQGKITAEAIEITKQPVLSSGSSIGRKVHRRPVKKNEFHSRGIFRACFFGNQVLFEQCCDCEAVFCGSLSVDYSWIDGDGRCPGMYLF